MCLDFNNINPEPYYYIHRKCTPTWKIDPAVTNFIDITYVIKGKAEYIIGDQKYHVKKGDLICMPKGIYRNAHSFAEDLMECYSINFFLRDKTGQEITLPLPVITNVGIIPKLISTYHEIQDEWMNQNFGYMMKIRASLCMILYQVINLLLNENNLGQEDPRIKNSIRYMSAHYSEPIAIDTVAELYHLHPVYFGSLFRRSTGITFKQYLISLRLSYAENLLRSGEYTVSEIAIKCGFSDVFYFSKLFKLKKGISPSELFPPEKGQKCEIPLLTGGERI